MSLLKRALGGISGNDYLEKHAWSCFQGGFAAHDFATKETHFSEYLLKLFGIQEKRLSLDAFKKQFSESSTLWLDAAFLSLEQGKFVEAYVLEVPRTGKFILCSAHTLFDQAESPLGILWFYDVTSHHKMEQHLIQQSAKLKADLKHHATILNMLPFPIWQRDKELNVNYYNLNYGEIVEDSGERAEGDALPELDRKERALATYALQQNAPQTERRHIVVGGARKFYQLYELPLGEEGVVGCAIDAGEVESLQEELQRHISAQSDFLDSSASAMAVYGADMRLKSFNYAFVNLWKLDEAWLDTQPSYGEILEALREKRNLPEQANFQTFKQQQLKLFTGLIQPHEEFFYLPDGKTLRVLAIPHALGGILFAYEDVTDRLALERSYNTLIAVQRETLDHLHEAIAVFGEDGKLRLSNPVYEKMWNFDEAQLRSEPHVSELMDRSKDLHIFDDWESYRQLRIGQIQARNMNKYRLERTDGKVIDCTTVPLPDGATLITYLDVTDTIAIERTLRERNDALQEADRLKTQFLANVSYELRSPLTSISGFSDMLRQEYFGALNPKQKEYIEGISTASHHLMNLINDILDLASIEAGYLKLDVTEFDIYTMIFSVQPLVKERVKEHKLDFKFTCPKTIGRMAGDETRLKQVLFNLLSNAIRYSNPGGQITLGAKTKGDDHVILYVSDTGPGIPSEEQEAIFGSFYKGKNTNIPKTKSKSGTGLGLSIVQNFINLHGGEIKLSSEVGKGTTVECIIPRTRREPT